MHFNWMFHYKPTSYWDTPIYGTHHMYMVIVSKTTVGSVSNTRNPTSHPSAKPPPFNTKIMSSEGRVRKT